MSEGRGHIKLIAVTGGIGSGKSVVSEVLRCLGYPVYDCDSRAKAIMDNDVQLKQRIALEVCAEAITPEGIINRQALSQCVFSDSEKLQTLNRLVHGAVLEDVARWRRKQSSPAFVETAILAESGLDKLVDAVWLVTAPEELRIRRVMRRNGLTAREVTSRMAAQNITVEADYTFLNDGITPLLPQIFSALQNG